MTGIRIFIPQRTLFSDNADIHGSLIVSQRLKVIRRLLDNEPVTIITTLDALMDRVLPLEYIAGFLIDVEEGAMVELEAMKKLLIYMGFERVGQVESPGQFAIRGGIIDIYNMSDDSPYRIELWDNEVDSIRSFDVESQRSIERAEKMTIYPASEYVFKPKVIENGIKAIEKERDAVIKKLNKEGLGEAALHLNQVVAEVRENLEESFGQTNIDSFIPYFL